LSVWLPVVFAVSVIAVESTDTFSANHTSNWLRPIVQHLVGPMQDNAWETFHHYLRKTGHFVGYGLVSLSFLRAWLHTIAEQRTKSPFSLRLESCVRAVISTAIVASCDEIHQSTIPSRTGTPYDVMLDTSGAITLCVLVWLVCWFRPGAPIEADA